MSGALWMGLCACVLAGPVRGEGRASSKAEAALAGEPHNLGLVLDLVVALCEEGQVTRAQRELLYLDARPDLPSGIAGVIAELRNRSDCREGWAADWWRPRGFVAVGAGAARNLNLGPAAERFFVSGLGQTVDLAEGSRPRNGLTAQVELGASWTLDKVSRQADGWTLSLYGSGQRFRDAPEFGLNGLNALASWRGSSDSDVQMEVALGSAQLNLADGTRLAAQTLHASSLRPWDSSLGLWWGGSVTATLLDYAQRAALDARQVEWRARWRLERSSWLAQLDAGWLDDREVRDRPGGNRQGLFLQAYTSWVSEGGLRADFQSRWGVSRDEAAYAPALFGPVQRQAHMLQTTVQLRQRLTPNLQLRIEHRWSRSMDRLPLFTYSTQQSMALVEWTWSEVSRR